MSLRMYIILCIASIYVLESCKMAKARDIITTYDVTNNDIMFPGVDITQELLETWNVACNASNPGKVVVRKGIFNFRGATFQGPCKSPIEFNLQGVLQAPKMDDNFTAGDTWVAFDHVDFLTISGDGIFDGQGKPFWGKECSEKEYCANLPINIRFNFVSHSIIRDVTSLDSKQFHVNVLGCQNVTFQHVKIIADANSPNTDGIHIGRSSDIRVLDSNIQTGDDCVSIGDGSKGITISNVACGPGHGISIGSLGKYTNEEPVEGVHITGCTLKNTQNGVRIKTWPGAEAGTASDLHFEDIVMENVGNPIVIDQEYCPYNKCVAMEAPSRVQIKRVNFKNIRGTSSTALAVKLVCSSGFPCQQVEMTDINLKYIGEEGPIASECKNVFPTLGGIQNPPACLTNSTTL